MKQIYLLLIINIVACFYLSAQKSNQPDIEKVERVDKNIGITKLTDKAYLIQTSYAVNGQLDCNHLLVVDTKDIVLVNTPVNDSLTKILLSYIEKKFKRKVSKVIVSHFHDDSSGGLHEISRCGINSFGLNKTQNLLRSQKRFIDFAFINFLTLSLQTTQLDLFYPGAGHTIDNIVLWLPDEKILFGGCLIKSSEAKDKGNIKDADLRAWPIAVGLIKDRYKDAKIVIPGHGDIGDSSLFDHTIQILEMN
jgi:metallo-beta-lactamase class B